MTARPKPRYVPFAYGFRPFFLLAGIHAVVAIGAWLGMIRHGAGDEMPLLPQLWHAHEMLFGFVTAAMAGFLLTAVPSWTGSRGFAGAPLVALTLLWLAGRLAFAMTSNLPTGILIVAELLFLPAVIVTIAPSLIRTVNRNTRLMFVLLLLWLADVVFLYGYAENDAAMMSASLRAALGLVLVLVTVIGGRIVPAFTGNALRAGSVEVRMRTVAALEYAVVAAMLAFVIADTFWPTRVATAVIAGVAGLLHVVRLSGWHGLKTSKIPIVWVLHVAYLWLPFGLLLKAVYVLTGADWSAFWQHALGAGAAGMMITAIMTRASLGHTGRPLQVRSSIAAAYVLLCLAVAVRVLGPALLPIAYSATIVIAGVLWMLAFAIYVVIYVPVLLKPRIDGKPG